MFCLFLASSFTGIFAQQQSLQQQRIEKVEQQVQEFTKKNMQNVPQEQLTTFKNSFELGEHGFSFNDLSPEEEKEYVDNFKKNYLRVEYFKNHPEAWTPYQAEMAPICDNGGFEDGNFDNYEGQSAIGSQGGYNGSPNGECSALPTSGFGGFSWTPTTLNSTTNNDNFTLVSSGNDPIVATGGGTLSMINPNSPDPNNSRAVRINSARPLPSTGSCSPNRGINRLIKPITLTEDGIQTVRFYYALVAEFPNHTNRNPIFVARALDGNNAELDRLCVISNPAGNPFFTRFTPNPYPCATNQVDILWQNWTCAELEISGNAGDVINLEFIVADCGFGAHFGYAYVDDICVEACQPGDNFQGSIQLNDLDPCEVTLPFDVCADFILPQLNGQTGTLSANDTSLEILQNGAVVETLTNGVITGNTICFSVDAADFDTQTGGYDFQVNAEFTIGGGTQTADDVHTIPGQDNDYIFNNPDCCDIAATVANIVCYDQGSTDPSDDTWSIELTVTNSAGTTWNATTPNADSGGYGNATLIDMGNISDFPGAFTFLVADDGDPSCSTTVTVEAPKPCSPPCDLEATVVVGECNDNGTPSDYSDDFYNVTITVSGTNGLPWMVKKKLESNGLETVIHNGTGDVVDLELGPFDVSDGDWTLWVSLTDYTDCLIDTFITVPNCCNDEPYIIPYWQHPACPEVVCTADQWPIHVLSSDGSTITNGNGITIVWDNLDTPADENDIQDWIYASAEENWQATITYPNGCEYIITYYEDCCDEDIFIRVLECPSDGQLQSYQTALEKAMEAASASQSASVESEAQNSSQAQQAQIQNELDRLRTYKEARANSSGDECDPCELGYVFIQLVDANGDEIDIDDYDTFSWNNGSMVTNALFDLPMEDGPACFTATKIEYGKECVYQDCFFYECEEECLCDELTLGDLTVFEVNECLYSISASSIVNCSSDQIASEEYSFTINNGTPITSTGNGIYHTFTANGDYDITMRWTVVDTEGCETTVSISETVKIDCIKDPDPCKVPTNLHYDCRRANLTWTGDANTSYIVEVNWDDPACCRGGANPTSQRWDVTGTSFQLPYINQSGCFSWRVGVKCKDEIVWSALACGSCDTKPHEPGTSSVKTVAKITPNPNDGNMNIEISGNDKTPFTLKVYRFDGTLIKTFNENRIENQSIKISWNGKSVLNQGMYFFVITTDTETITKKVIIE
ncbi:hypothetical protein IMCC3317_31940 [Kordia antarctica]|uniref:Secretion system C-terminal sorting domain-containing protein n=2 Tax=Kordia antarctica TaxID=1218801 RepID=A0A7L4ZMR7_9FLAO|nr:hypothetical protein IMCC3317_31940 [Kordia antarctica]